MEKKIWFIGLAAICLVACSKSNGTSETDRALRVQTTVVSATTDPSYLRYAGTVECRQQIPLSVQTTGRVVSVPVKNGTMVHKGQVLLTIDDTQARNALHTAEATLRHAQDGYDRIVKVHEKGVVSDQKLVEIESELAQAKALHAAAKRQVEECTLHAPCNGLINGLNIVPGQSVIPDVTLCTIMDLTGFQVRFTVPENEVSRVGESGMMECAAVDSVFPVTVMERNLQGNALTHTYEVVAAIEGGEEILMAGMIAVVKISNVQSPISNVIVIPAACVSLMPEGHTVWVAENGQAVRRLITVNGYMADGVCVTEGLQVGDHLITNGYQKLYNGCKVIEDE